MGLHKGGRVATRDAIHFFNGKLMNSRLVDAVAACRHVSNGPVRLPDAGNSTADLHDSADPDTFGLSSSHLGVMAPPVNTVHHHMHPV